MNAIKEHFPECPYQQPDEILKVSNIRHEIDITTAVHSYKLCYDKFEYYSRNAQQGCDPLYEIEVEQMDGDEIEKDVSILKLSSTLTELMGFEIEKRSKFKKGMDWLDGNNTFFHHLFVLFDFVSYSVKPSSDQLQLVRSFTKLTQTVLQENNLDCVKIPIGDGVILGFPTNTNIMKFINAFFFKLHSDNDSTSEDRRLCIRTAIHYGPIYEYVDINGNSNYAGSGINIVARIGSEAGPNQVLLSEECVKYLTETRKINNNNLDPVYEVVVKHGETLHVRNYYDRKNRVGCPM